MVQITGLDDRLGRRRFLAATAAAAGVVPVAALTARASPAQGIAIDLGGAMPGQLPQGFTAARTGKGAPGAWAVQDDPSIPGRRVVAQTSTEPTDYRFPLLVYETLSLANVDVVVRFKAVAGRVDRAGGLVVRLADPDNYYVVRANALEDNVNFYRVVKGSRHEIQGAAVPVPAGVWHTLGLTADGDRFTVRFADKVLFTASDRMFAQAGRIALWTKADSVTRFDALSVTALP